MFRIRFHGRGGQGTKTASRILGRAFFLEGFEVQEAPRYGAERRGAPIFAYVRAGRETIQERGIITNPDLVLVADDTLVSVPVAGVMQGIDARTVLLIAGPDDAATWNDRLQTEARILTVPAMATGDGTAKPHIGVICAGAAARLVGCISEASLLAAVEAELAPLGAAVAQANLAPARNGFQAMADHHGQVSERPSGDAAAVPDWIDIPFEPARVSSPTIHAPLTSVLVRTGLWRTLRPELEAEHCKKCIWVCASVCPDGVIGVTSDGFPAFDYDHCKGCMICVAQCPRHAILALPEREAAGASGGAA